MLQIIVCILIADFITGFVHWLEDTYCTKGFPVIGGAVCIPNIDHHKYPKLMVEGANLIKTNYQSFSIAAIVLFIAFILGLFSWQLLLVAVLASFGNQVHLWNHEAKSSYWVQFLKDASLIQSQKQHSIHHIPPYDKNYCVLIDFNNAWMTRVDFWKKLENFLLKFGLKPKRLTEERDGF